MIFAVLLGFCYDIRTHEVIDDKTNSCADDLYLYNRYSGA